MTMTMTDERTPASTGNAVATLTTPGTMTAIADRMRMPADEAAALGISLVIGPACALTLALSSSMGLMTATMLLSFFAVSIIIAAGILVSQFVERLVQGNAAANRLYDRTTGRRTAAAAAARMLSRDWDRSSIKTDTGYIGRPSRMGEEKRLTIIELPNGSTVQFAHRRSGRPLIVLHPHGHQGHLGFDQDRALGIMDGALVMRTIERLQLDRISQLLGLPPGLSPVAMSRIVAQALPVQSRDMESSDSYDHSSNPTKWTIEQRTIDGAEIRVTSIRKKTSRGYADILLEAPGIGILRLPSSPFGAVMHPRRMGALKLAFGEGEAEVLTLPVFVGNARASRLVDLARQILAGDPDRVDASGMPLRTLVEKHLPRLLATHRDNTRTARTADIPEIDAALERGLDAIARGLREALDTVADDKLDALRTEVRFLESRHPAEDGLLSAPVERQTA